MIYWEGMLQAQAQRVRPENTPNYYRESYEYCYPIWEEESIWLLCISGYDAVL